MGDSHGTGVGTAGLAGAAGLAAGGVAGDAAAGFAGTASTGGEAGFSAAGLVSPSGGDEGDLMSSGIGANTQSFGFKDFGENVNFYQLESSVSTNPAQKKALRLLLRH